MMVITKKTVLGDPVFSTIGEIFKKTFNNFQLKIPLNKSIDISFHSI